MKNKAGQILIVFACIPFFQSCISVRPKPYYDKSYKDWESQVAEKSLQIEHTVFLIGDAGQPAHGFTEPTFRLLQTMLYSNIDTQFVRKEGGANLSDTVLVHTSEKNGTVVFLGDNIYYRGLPKEGAIDRKESERRIIEQMKIVKPYKGNKFFIPGNHDWGADGGAPDGMNDVIREEKFVEAYFDSADIFKPGNACPGPTEIHLNDKLVLILIDSQWWLHRFRKPVGIENDCNVESQLDFIIQLQDILERNSEKNVLICQHHPLFTNGNHGGYYSLKDYIFPLTLLRENLFIPLPLIGSIYPFARKYGVSNQDISNPEYHKMINSMLAALEDHKYLVFAAGHEHSLQFHKYRDINHIVSGSGCKDNMVVKGNNAGFAYEHEGFAKINYYTNGEVWVEFWVPEGKGETGKIVFRTPLYAQFPRTVRKEFKDEKTYTDSIKTIAAGEQYDASRFAEIFLGEHYRKEWQTPVTAPYLDFKKYGGGLTPVKKGGGRQTTSIRLSGNDGYEYALRSINKDPANILPKPLRRTFADDLLQDQISSAHPYAALAIPDMAEKIGVFHSSPKLFYVPYTPLLGPYLDDMGGKLAILEIRPDENIERCTMYGFCEKVVSTRTMYFNLKSSNKHSVDQYAYLRARLFDMLINDWDRHEDQWLWAKYEGEENTVYRPLPRDRDQAFTKYDGIIPWLISRKWAIRNLNGFRHDYEDIVGLNLSGANLDKNILNGLSREQWRAIADSIKFTLDDKTIEEAVRKMPPEAFKNSGEEIISKLKSRRDKLPQAAMEFYELLSETVEIAGSDKSEFALVERLGKDETRVRLFDFQKDRGIGNLFYDRTFRKTETEEIRIFMLEGEDSIVVTGTADETSILRIVGGRDKDYFIDRSKVGGIGKPTVFYDNEEDQNIILTSKESKKHVSEKYNIEKYEFDAFQYNYIGPRVKFEYNPDDGLLTGVGLVRKTHGFRIEPIRSHHQVFGQYAGNTASSFFKYNGNFFNLFGKDYDLILSASTTGPRYLINYFGEGNETEADLGNPDFYKVRIFKTNFYPAIHKRPSKYFKAGIGPFLEFTRVDPDEFRISNEITSAKSGEQGKWYAGIKLFSEVDLRDLTNFPSRGSKWRNEINYLKGLKGDSTHMLNLNTDLTFFLTPNWPLRMTFAFRFGGGHNYGEYNFYQANSLGGNTNLRGFRNNRFSGRSMVFNNTEIRARLFTFRNYVITGNWGLLAFSDQGRVWVNGENSEKFHWSYGPGLWVNFYNQILISAHYGISEESGYFTLRGGMFF